MTRKARIVLMWFVVGAATAGAEGITFTKIVGTDTPVPGQNAAFRSVFDACTFEGMISFQAMVPGDEYMQYALYWVHAGQFLLVADCTTPIPGYPSFFSGFSPMQMGPAGAFTGFDPNDWQGIYRWSPAVGVTVIVDRYTPDPGGHGNLRHFFLSARDGDCIGFMAFTSQMAAGIYRATCEADVELLAGPATPIPGGYSTFDSFGFNVSIGAGAVAFIGASSSDDLAGVYLASNTVRRVADTRTSIPGQNVCFTYFGDRPSTDGGRVAFVGAAWQGGQWLQKGVYTDVGGTLRTVADLNTIIPGQNVPFTDFTELYGPALCAGRVAFHAEGPAGYEGIFIGQANGRLLKVVDTNTVLEVGKTIQDVSIEEQCLYGSDLVFTVTFNPAVPGTLDQAIYMAHLVNARGLSSRR